MTSYGKSERTMQASQHNWLSKENLKVKARQENLLAEVSLRKKSGNGKSTLAIPLPSNLEDWVLQWIGLLKNLLWMLTSAMQYRKYFVSSTMKVLFTKDTDSLIGIPLCKLHYQILKFPMKKKVLSSGTSSTNTIQDT